MHPTIIPLRRSRDCEYVIPGMQRNKRLRYQIKAAIAYPPQVSRNEVRVFVLRSLITCGGPLLRSRTSRNLLLFPSYRTLFAGIAIFSQGGNGCKRWLQKGRTIFFYACRCVCRKKRGPASPKGEAGPRGACGRMAQKVRTGVRLPDPGRTLSGGSPRTDTQA